MLTIGIKRLASMLSGLLILCSAHRAHAEVGFLPPDSMACTDQVRSDNGVTVFSHTVTSPGVTWTVLMSITEEGEPTEIFRAERSVLPPTNIDPPDPGIFFFRACVSSSPSDSARYAFNVVEQAGSVDYTLDVGSHTAVLAPFDPSGQACGGFGSDQDRRVGESTVPVLWSVLTFDGDLNFLGETSQFTGTSVDDVITLTGVAIYFFICATNTSETTATLSFDVL